LKRDVVNRLTVFVERLLPRTGSADRFDRIRVTNPV
jgi:hypothetical protein